MNKEMLIAYLIIQFVVQYALYRVTKKPVFGVAGLISKLEKEFNPASNYKTTMTALSVIMFLLNIGLSILVKFFTESGGMTGMTNLGASVILGFFMSFDCFLFKIKLNKQETSNK